MATAAASILKTRVDREGYLKKNASAKGKDEVRGNWKERCVFFFWNWGVDFGVERMVNVREFMAIIE